MNPYFCVVYRFSDTYRCNFATAAEAFAFAADHDGTVYACDAFGNIVGKL